MREHLNKEHWRNEYCELHPGVKIYEIDNQKICGQCDIMRANAEANAKCRIECEKIDNYYQKLKNQIEIKNKEWEEDYKTRQYKD